MFLELKENVAHGTKEYPYTQYFIHNVQCKFQFPVHWHNELEIISISQGNLNLAINGVTYKGTPDSIYIVNPRELHLMEVQDLSVVYHTLLFPLEFISFQTIDDLETKFLQPLRNGQIFLKNEILLNEKTSALLKDIIALNATSNFSTQFKTRILLLDLFCEFLTHDNIITPATENIKSTTQKDILMYIQDNYTKPLSLKDLADTFHLSEKYLSRYFSEHFHITFTKYVNHLRLAQARKLLETTDLPVTEIALQSGFSNVSYFIRMFKQSYGSSPLKYRHT